MKRQGHLWNPEAETMPRQERVVLQGRRLRKQFERAYERVPLYRQAFEERGVHTRDIQAIEDIERLPFTTKEDFRTTYPYGLFAVPLSEVVRLHASSGTTGKPVVGGYTRADLAMWGEVMARTAIAEDRLQENERREAHF